MTRAGVACAASGTGREARDAPLAGNAGAAGLEPTALPDQFFREFCRAVPTPSGVKPIEPGIPLNGPATQLVIQPP
jgi:hypothetical protein